jgi:hypothetical protein
MNLFLIPINYIRYNKLIFLLTGILRFNPETGRYDEENEVPIQYRDD